MTHIVLLWKDCKFSARRTGIFTCFVSNSVICFIGFPCVNGRAGSVACPGLPSVILAACFPQVWGTFIPVEIKIKTLIYCHRK